MSHVYLWKQRLYFILTFFCLACSGTHPQSRSQSRDESCHAIRLTRAWDTKSFDTIGAIQRRGPLRIGIWGSKEFADADLKEQGWVAVEVVEALSLRIDYDLQGKAIIRDAFLELDGVGNVQTNSLYLSPAQKGIQPLGKYDVIIPLSDLIERASSRPVIINGHLLLSDVETCKDLSVLPAIERFTELWSPQKALPLSPIGQRVDLGKEVTIQWTQPLIDLPADLWLIVDLAKEGEASWPLGLWIAPQQRFQVAFDKPLTTNIKPTPSQLRRLSASQCHGRSPCPIRILDVVRRNERCQSDICTYVPSHRSMD